MVRLPLRSHKTVVVPSSAGLFITHVRLKTYLRRRLDKQNQNNEVSQKNFFRVLI